MVPQDSQLIGDYLDSLRKELLPESSQADPWEGQGPESTAEEAPFCELEIIVAFCIQMHRGGEVK